MKRSTAEVAGELNVSPASIKNWLTVHGSVIGAVKAANGRWQYNEQVISHLAQIKQALALGHSHKEISQLLASGDIDNLALTPMATIKTGEIAALLQPLDLAIAEIRKEQRETKELLVALVELLTPAPTPKMLEPPQADSHVVANEGNSEDSQRPARWWRRKSRALH